MTTSIESEIESQLLNAITSSGVTGVNFYGADRRTPKIMPYVFADVEIADEDLAPFTGIFSCTATIQYRARADDSSNPSFDSKFQEIVDAFYTSPNIAEQMTSSSNSVTFYLASIRQVNPTVVSQTRSWSKDIVLDIKATSKET